MAHFDRRFQWSAYMGSRFFAPFQIPTNYFKHRCHSNCNWKISTTELVLFVNQIRSNYLNLLGITVQWLAITLVPKWRWPLDKTTICHDFEPRHAQTLCLMPQSPWCFSIFFRYLFSSVEQFFLCVPKNAFAKCLAKKVIWMMIRRITELSPLYAARYDIKISWMRDGFRQDLIIQWTSTINSLLNAS